jgi:alpha-L-fucosidase 2
MMKFFWIACLITPLLLPAQGTSHFFEVDYATYLAKHDIVYKTPAYEGFEGFPLGNGDLGGMIWNSPNGIQVQINKNDLYDQPNEEAGATLRGGARLSVDLGLPAFEWLYLENFEGRLSLKDAAVTMTSRTPFQETGVSSWVAADKNVWFFRINTRELNRLPGGSKIRVSLERLGSRTFAGWYGGYSKDASIGLGNTRSLIKGRDIILEEHFNGLDFSVACRITGEEVSSAVISSNRVELETSGTRSHHDIILMAAMVTSAESADPTQAAIGLLNDSEKENIEVQRALHQEWWNDFWKQSFVHLGDDYIENIYYLRRYLMGSSSRGKYPVVFNGGLWTWNHDVRNWVTPHHWNTQQQYWGLCPQNDCGLLLPYVNTYFRLMPEAEKHAKTRGADSAILWSEPHDFFGSMTFWERGDMLNNFTPASQIAGFFWDYFQFTCDTAFLRQKAYPFMKKAAEFYVQKLEWDSLKQEFFIYPSQPYESPDTHTLLNPTSDRTMIESLFKSCIESARLLKTDAGKIRQWQHITGHLWPIPMRQVHGEGEVMELAYYKDGTIYPKLEKRTNAIYHFSANTSVIFPANLLGIDDAGDPRFKAASVIVRHHPPFMNAISPDPIVAARLGLGDETVRMMTNGIRRLQHFPQGLFYNIDHWYNLSLYMDSVKQPDITTQRDYIYDERAHYPNGHPAKPFIQCGLEPHSIYGAAINEMLLQSHENKIRIFPAVPSEWPAAFRLRARGGFMVSAERRTDGVVPGISIESLKGSLCRVVNPWQGCNVRVLDMTVKRKDIKFNVDQDHVIVFKTIPGHIYLITEQAGPELKSKTVFEGKPNQEPKQFREAMLGKFRNF